MAERVERWRATDGTLFTSQHEAQEHDRKEQARQDINDWCELWLSSAFNKYDVAEQMIDNIDELREALGCET